MGGGGHTETVTKQDNTPWGPAQPALTDIYGQAKTAYDATPKQAYGGSYIAPQSQSTILAQMLGQQLAGKSMGLGDQVNKTASDLFGHLNSGLTTARNTATNPGTIGAISSPTGEAGQFSDYINKFIGGTANPLLAQQGQALLDPLLQNLQEKIIPQAKLNAVGSGTYGGDANNIGLSQSINDNYTRDATNAMTNLAYQDYNQRFQTGAQGAQDFFNRSLQLGTTNADIEGKNIQNKLQGAQLMPGLAEASTGAANSQADLIQKAFGLNALPIDAMAQIGQQQDAYQQDMVKALYQQWQDQLNAPWQGLEQYRGAISGYPNSSSGTSSSNTSGGGLF
jgi:hypothetical protein